MRINYMVIWCYMVVKKNQLETRGHHFVYQILVSNMHHMPWVSRTVAIFLLWGHVASEHISEFPWRPSIRSSSKFGGSKQSKQQKLPLSCGETIIDLLKCEDTRFSELCSILSWDILSGFYMVLYGFIKLPFQPKIMIIHPKWMLGYKIHSLDA